MIVMKRKIGLIAGSDQLPFIFIEEAKKSGEEVVVAAIEGFTSREIEKKAKTFWLKPGQLDRIAAIFKTHDVKYAAMEGRIPQSIIFSDTDFDSKAKAILSSLENRQTQSLLKAVAGELESHGISLLDARTHLDPVIAKKGVMTIRKPEKNEWIDIEFGRNVLTALGPLDVGQSVVVKKGAILAIEAIEGTDAAIERGAVLGKEKSIVVKMAKPDQDMRFDLPVIGAETIDVMCRYGACTIAIEAGKTVVLDKSMVVKKADEGNIAIAVI